MSRAKQKMTQPRRTESLREWIQTVLIVLVVVITFRGVVAQVYQIPSGSMERTLLIGDYLYINKMLYGSEIDIGFGGHRFFYHRFPAIRQPRPGDIIVFRYPVDPRQDFIKRCVAVAGQTVAIRDKVVYVDGVKREEPFAVHDDPRILPGRDNFGPYIVPPGCLFMMVDNRDNSSDSRFWGFVPKDSFKGKILYIYYSRDQEKFCTRWDRIGKTPR